MSAAKSPDLAIHAWDDPPDMNESSESKFRPNPDYDFCSPQGAADQRVPARRFWVSFLTSPTLYILVGLLVAGWAIFRWLAEQDLETFRETYGWAAIAIIWPSHVMIALSPIPSDFVTIANGALFGVVIGTLMSWAAAWCAAMLQFGIGRRARLDFHLDRHRRQLPERVRNLPVGHPVYLIGVRQIPWLGMHVGSFVPGAAGVSWRRFICCSAIGAIPGALLMAAIGAGIVRWM